MARLAGVSVSSASRALRGQRLRSPEDAERIRRVAARVGYHVNPMLSDMMRRVRRRGRLQHLGSMAYLTFHATPTAWRENATYREFFEGAKQRADDFGFALEEIWAGEPDLDARRLTEILAARGLSAVLVGPRPTPTEPELLDWSQFSSVVVGMPLLGLQLHRAGSAHLSSMERLLRALAQRGYRKPGLVLLEVQASPTDPGWAAGWAYHESRAPRGSRVPLLVMKTRSEAAFQQWYREHEPDVVIGLEDEIVKWLEAAGRRVPEDVGYARLSRPATGRNPAGLHQFPRAIGAAAVDLLSNQVFANERGVPATPRTLLIDAKWMDGWSVRDQGLRTKD